MMRAEPPEHISTIGWATCLWVDVDLTEEAEGSTPAVLLIASELAHPRSRNRLLLERPHGAAWCARVALDAGDFRLAALAVTCANQLAVDNPASRTLAAASEHASGVYNRDPELLAHAALLYAHPLSAANAEEDAATLAASCGDLEGARELLQRARARYSKMKAYRSLGRVEHRQRDLSYRRGRRRSASTWRGLTHAEQRVAFTVANGRTNAQAARDLCLSRHTVDFHLRQVFRKLCISSRVELARLVAMEGVGSRCSPDPTMPGRPDGGG
jgi:DNA-binding CsgD family transcriptional regulator